jgi:hypothetical protein
MDSYFRALLRNFATTNDPGVAMKIAALALRINDLPLPEYLVIGFHYEQGFTFSSCFDDISNPDDVSARLANEAGIPDDAFDEILIVQNGEECPEVIHAWALTRDYD